jgi:hypothetical protein
LDSRLAAPDLPHEFRVVHRLCRLVVVLLDSAGKVLFFVFFSASD